MSIHKNFLNYEKDKNERIQIRIRQEFNRTFFN